MCERDVPFRTISLSDTAGASWLFTLPFSPILPLPNTVGYNYVKIFDTPGVEIFHATIADSISSPAV
jgi:hypothetical protein